MTRVCPLCEIHTSVPISKENPRKFKIDMCNLTLVDLDKAIAANTFEANVIWPKEMTDGEGEVERPTILVELFFQGGFSVITLMDGDIERGLTGFNEIYDDIYDDDEDEDVPTDSEEKE